VRDGPGTITTHDDPTTHDDRTRQVCITDPPNSTTTVSVLSRFGIEWSN